MFYMHNLGWGSWLLMSIGMVVLWALLIYGIVWLARGGWNVHQRDESPSESPKQTLKRRLAQGEISVEEYERLLETLDDQPSDGSIAA